MFGVNLGENLKKYKRSRILLTQCGEPLEAREHLGIWPIFLWQLIFPLSGDVENPAFNPGPHCTGYDLLKMFTKFFDRLPNLFVNKLLRMHKWEAECIEANHCCVELPVHERNQNIPKYSLWYDTSSFSLLFTYSLKEGQPSNSVAMQSWYNQICDALVNIFCAQWE